MAMASPCEVLLDMDDAKLAQRLTSVVYAEELRIEHTYSRYREDSVVAAINASRGTPVRVDEETARLLDFAAACWRDSHGRFDLSSGVLRRAWCFDGSDRAPSRAQVKALLPLVGWEKVHWRSPEITLPAGMEIGFGGLGKEYAVDRAIALVCAEAEVPTLVNFGGDLHAPGPRRNGEPWCVGVEDPGHEDRAERTLELHSGALATSGDARRYLLRKGRRYSHILDPRTGWSVQGAPRSITVIAHSCTEAGILATTAMVHGKKAEEFLAAQGIQWWVTRD